MRCTKQELQLVVDALAQRKEESLEFKERAIEAFNVQNFKRAEQHLSSAIELDPENHVFYSNRAAAYMAMEKFDRALKDANECAAAADVGEGVLAPGRRPPLDGRPPRRP